MTFARSVPRRHYDARAIVSITAIVLMINWKKNKNRNEGHPKIIFGATNCFTLYANIFMHGHNPVQVQIQVLMAHLVVLQQLESPARSQLRYTRFLDLPSLKQRSQKILASTVPRAWLQLQAEPCIRLLIFVEGRWRRAHHSGRGSVYVETLIRLLPNIRAGVAVLPSLNLGIKIFVFDIL